MSRDEFRKLFRRARELREELARIEDMFKPMWHYEDLRPLLYSIRDRGSYLEIQLDLSQADEKTIDIHFEDIYMFIRARLKKEVVFHRLSGRGGETRFQNTVKS
jgi:HSP20 family molecular chaperone IbpA